MKVLRYFGLVALYHLLTFYKQTPWAFIVGTVMIPYFIVSRCIYPTEQHSELVLNGISQLKSYWQIPGAILPPKFLEKRFDALETELKMLSSLESRFVLRL